MAMTFQPAALFGGLLTALALAVAGPAAAAETMTGYRSADFGMTSEAVMARLEEDGVVNVSVVETDEGDLIIDGELQAADEPETDLRYVFPSGRDRLALVVAFYPEVEDFDRVKAQLEARYGQPWETEMADWWFEQLKEDMPQPRSASPCGAVKAVNCSSAVVSCGCGRSRTTSRWSISILSCCAEHRNDVVRPPFHEGGLSCEETL